ncbi:MAG: SH3 domain-containing protein [Clostridiales bacterium]|nr:SH3 domain-containing protein [Clostridiales bacterium]
MRTSNSYIRCCIKKHAGIAILMVLVTAFILAACAGENLDIRYDLSAEPEYQLFPPGDQAFGEDFTEALEEFKTIVKNRNQHELEHFLDENVRTSFDVEYPTGPDEFNDAWLLDTQDYKISAVWEVLESVLSLEGVYDAGAGTYHSPYTYFACPDRFKDDNIDLCFAVTAEGVNLYEKKDLKSKIIARIDYNIVYLDVDERDYNEKPPTELVKINTAGGVIGYVQKQYLHSLVDNRILMHRTEDGWRLKYLVSGRMYEWYLPEE